MKQSHVATYTRRYDANNRPVTSQETPDDALTLHDRGIVVCEVRFDMCDGPHGNVSIVIEEQFSQPALLNLFKSVVEVLEREAQGDG